MAPMASKGRRKRALRPSQTESGAGTLAFSSCKGFDSPAHTPALGYFCVEPRPTSSLGSTAAVVLERLSRDVEATFPLNDGTIRAVHEAAILAHSALGSGKDIKAASLPHDVEVILRTARPHGDPGDPGRQLLSLLLLTSTIERYLKDVLKAVAGIAEPQVPFLLRDVLLMQPLVAALGRETAAFLQVLIGPVQSFNLRNISWHGFAHASDFGPSAGAYASLLLLILDSVADKLCHLTISPSYKTSLHGFYCDGSGSCEGEDWRPMAVNLCGFFAASPFTLRSTLPSWQMVSSPGISSLELVSALLPLFEEHLRHTFVSMNSLPETLLLTAEAGAKYLDLDALLAGSLTGEGEGRANTLRQHMGEGFMNLAHDLFVLPAGPRVRDRVSHGEASNAELNICSAVCCRLIEVVVFLFARASEVSSSLAPVVSGVGAYRSRFHPLAVCMRLLGTLTSVLRRASEAALGLGFGEPFFSAGVELMWPDTLHRSSTTVQAAKTICRALAHVVFCVSHVADLLERQAADPDNMSEEATYDLRRLNLLVAEGRGRRLEVLLRTATAAIAHGDRKDANAKRGFLWVLSRMETSAERLRSALGRNDLQGISTEVEALEEDIARSSCLDVFARD